MLMFGAVVCFAIAIIGIIFLIGSLNPTRNSQALFYDLMALAIPVLLIAIAVGIPIWLIQIYLKPNFEQWIFLIVIVPIMILSFMYELRASNQQTSPRRDNQKHQKHSSKPIRSQEDLKYEQLLGMLNGDREVADNLIRVYGVDKAIDDLIRDRR